MTPKKKAIAAGALVALLAAPLASSAVRGKLAGAWRGFSDPSSTQPAPQSPPPETELELSGNTEDWEIEGDFSLADLDDAESMTHDGVVYSLSDLPIAITHRTLRYVEYFGSTIDGRDSFTTRYKRAARYREFIEESLRYADFPEDVLWLAAIESGFVPQATSPKGAVGLFQFMPETGDRFGLANTPEIDERRSITRSTEACIAYLTILRERYGAWDLALAAYNWGEGNVDEALAKGREKLNREPEDTVAFHELASLKLLPKETADFVPKIHAFAIVAHNVETLDLEDLNPLPPMRFAQIAVPAGTKLATVAHAAGVSVATLRDYNPEFLTDRVPAGRSDVLVSVSTDLLAQTLAALPAHIAREEPPPKPTADTTLASTTGPSSKSSETKKASAATEGADKGATKEVSVTTDKILPKSPAPKAAKKVTLRPAPMRPDSFLLSSGVILEVKKEDASEVTITARVKVLDPLKNRAVLGTPFDLTEKRVAPGDLKVALEEVKKDVRGLALAAPAAKLRAHLADKRKTLHDKVQSRAPFLELSSRMFPQGHPMHGSILVGPTEPADDMFLEVEPTWALDTVITVKGPVDAEAMAADIEAAFADTFVPTKSAALPKGAHATVGKNERRVLVGWSAPALRSSNETAQHLAFILACHNKLGRFHRALRHDRSMTGRLNCSLELSPHAAVPWVFAMPSMPYTVADVEKEIDKVVVSLSTDGPSDAELTAARGLLRAELAKERDSATLRGLPKSFITARNEAILENLDAVTKKDIVEATKILFSKDRRVAVISD